MNQIKTFQARFILILIPLLVICFVGISQLIQFERQTHKQSFIDNETGHFKAAELIIQNYYFEAYTDLITIIDYPEFHSFISKNNRASKSFIETMFIHFVERFNLYDQLRYIDESGKEQIRVNLVDGHASLVGQMDLQDKSGRYYFEESINLPRG